MNFENIQYRVENGVGILKLNRPQSLNSFTVAMHLEIQQVMADVKANSQVRCLLITGEGRVFVPGRI